jgi:hypothetical protein
MLLTVSLSGWHKEVATPIFMPTLAVVSKGPRSFQLRGPFALPGLRHDISILLSEHGLKSMGDDLLACLEPAALDSLVDRSPQEPRYPDVQFPITSLSARLAEALNPLDTFHVRHGTPPIALVTYREMPDSELAVESRVKNPFTIGRFSGGKLV